MLERSLEEVRDLVTNFKKWDVEIHWDLTMRCNYACRYCESYDNNIPSNLKDLDTYIKSIKYLKRYFGNKTARIVFLGGEPTLFKDWAKLLEFCVDEGFYPEVTTNLSLKLKTLQNKLKDKKIGKCIDVSWHPSFVPDEDEMIDKINFLYSNNYLRSVSVLGDVGYWDKVLSALKKLDNLKNIVSVSQIYDEAANKISITVDPWEMSDEQKEVMYFYKSHSQQDWELSINGKKYQNGEKYLEENNLLNFKGLFCAVGQKRISILPNGDVYPSVCLYNYKKACIGNVFKETLIKPRNPIKCQFNICRCGPDIRIEKHKKLEDFND